MNKIKQVWMGELNGKVYPRWLENYMKKHRIPDVALELREDRLIAHAVVVSNGI